jgi:hypothetical protein
LSLSLIISSNFLFFDDFSAGLIILFDDVGITLLYVSEITLLFGIERVGGIVVLLLLHSVDSKDLLLFLSAIISFKLLKESNEHSSPSFRIGSDAEAGTVGVAGAGTGAVAGVVRVVSCVEAVTGGVVGVGTGAGGGPGAGTGVVSVVSSVEAVTGGVVGVAGVGVEAGIGGVVGSDAVVGAAAVVVAGAVAVAVVGV